MEAQESSAQEQEVGRTSGLVSCRCCTRSLETTLLVFLTQAGGISPCCEKLERRTLHLHVETKSLELLRAGNPALGTTIPPQSTGQWMETQHPPACSGPASSYALDRSRVPP